MFTATGGNVSETFTPDISGAGLSDRPLAGALNFSCCDVSKTQALYNWDASTSKNAAVTVTRLNGEKIYAGALFRVTGILIGK